MQKWTTGTKIYPVRNSRFPPKAQQKVSFQVENNLRLFGTWVIIPESIEINHVVISSETLMALSHALRIIFVISSTIIKSATTTTKTTTGMTASVGWINPYSAENLAYEWNIGAYYKLYCGGYHWLASVNYWRLVELPSAPHSSWKT